MAGERPLVWAHSECHFLDLGLLGHLQRVVDLDSEVADRAP